MYIRKAITDDVKTIHKILNHYANQGFLLPRSLNELYDHVRDYFVIDSGNREIQGPLDENSLGADNGRTPAPRERGEMIQGVCGLNICWEDLAEIKSLAVCEPQKGKGFGLQLVQTCLEEARFFGLKKVFTLTYIPEFFIKIGFKPVDKSALPHKIWSDCLNCPKFPDCDENSLMMEL